MIYRCRKCHQNPSACTVLHAEQLTRAHGKLNITLCVVSKVNEKRKTARRIVCLVDRFHWLPQRALRRQVRRRISNTVGACQFSRLYNRRSLSSDWFESGVACRPCRLRWPLWVCVADVIRSRFGHCSLVGVFVSPLRAGIVAGSRATDTCAYL